MSARRCCKNTTDVDFNQTCTRNTNSQVWPPTQVTQVLSGQPTAAETKLKENRRLQCIQEKRGATANDFTPRNIYAAEIRCHQNCERETQSLSDSKTGSSDEVRTSVRMWVRVDTGPCVLCSSGCAVRTQSSEGLLAEAAAV